MLETAAKARKLAAALRGEPMDAVTENEMLVRNTLIVTAGIALILTAATVGIALPSDRTLEIKQLEAKHAEALQAVALERAMVERGFVKLAAGTWISTSCVGRKN